MKVSWMWMSSAPSSSLITALDCRRTCFSSRCPPPTRVWKKLPRHVNNEQRTFCTIHASFLQLSQDIFSAVLFPNFCGVCELTYVIIGCFNRFRYLLTCLLKSHCIVGPVAWTSRKFKWRLRSFRVPIFVILNVSFHAFYERKWEKKRHRTAIQLVKRIQNDVQDDLTHDAQWSWASFKFNHCFSSILTQKENVSFLSTVLS